MDVIRSPQVLGFTSTTLSPHMRAVMGKICAQNVHRTGRRRLEVIR